MGGIWDPLLENFLQEDDCRKYAQNSTEQRSGDQRLLTRKYLN